MKSSLLAVNLVLLVAGCGGGGMADRSGEISSSIGGTCTATSYVVLMRVDHSKNRIYDCTVGTKRMCVTESNGIANDQTALVRLLFANALSGGKPDCLNG